MELTIYILGIFVIGMLIYISGNLYNKTKRYETIVTEQETDIEDLTNLIIDIQTRIQDTHERILDLDKKGSFQSDDEIGFFFQEIKGISEELTQLVDLTKEEEDDNNG